MRVLMASWPTLGHLHPCLGLADALRDAGHEILVATSPGMAGHVRASGHPHVTMGFDIGRGDDPITPRLVTRTVKLLQDSMGFFTDDLHEHAAQWRADILIQDWSLPAGAAAADRLGLPTVAIGQIIHPPLDQLAASQCFLGSSGLEPHRIFGDLLLNFYPPSLAWPELPSLGYEHHIQAPFYDGRTTGPAPDWLLGQDGSPMICATMGSSLDRWPGIFECFIEVAGETDATVVLTVHDRDPASFGPLPGNVRIEKYVPLSLLFPRLSAIICQGGAHTLLGALGHGVPVGAVTLGPILEAQRCEQVGAGVTYQVDHDDRTIRLDPDRIHRMIASLLRDDGYRQAARRVRDDFRSLPDLRHGVKLIESLV